MYSIVNRSILKSKNKSIVRLSSSILCNYHHQHHQIINHNSYSYWKANNNNSNNHKNRHQSSYTTKIKVKFPLITFAGVTLASLLKKEHDKKDEKNKNKLELYSIADVGDRPSIIYKIFILNGIVFLCWRLPPLQPHMMRYFAIHYENILMRRIGVAGTLFSFVGAAFSHQSPIHLAMNMYALYNFGPPIIAMIGENNFIKFYLGSAVVSSAIQIFYDALRFRYGGALVRGMSVPGLGASGAIFALVCCWALTFPDRKLIIIFLPWFPVDASVLFSGVVIFDLLGAAYTFVRKGTGLGHAAHLGGTLAGYLYWTQYYGYRKTKSGWKRNR